MTTRNKVKVEYKFHPISAGWRYFVYANLPKSECGPDEWVYVASFYNKQQAIEAAERIKGEIGVVYIA